MAIYLASWRVVSAGLALSDGFASIEEAINVSHAADVVKVLVNTADRIRNKLRNDSEYRKSLGIESTSPKFLNIVFQPPLTKIDC